MIGWLPPSLIGRCAPSEELLREHEELLCQPLLRMPTATSRSDAVDEVGMLSRGEMGDEERKEER